MLCLEYTVSSALVRKWFSAECTVIVLKSRGLYELMRNDLIFLLIVIFVLYDLLISCSINMGIPTFVQIYVNDLIFTL